MNAETNNEPGDAPENTTVVNARDLNEELRSMAVLADLTISMWGAERTDRKIMEDVKQRAGAVGNVGRTVKNLLAGADEKYVAAKSQFQAMRGAHYQLTLPWVSDLQADRQTGPRLLPNVGFNRYLAAMSTRQRAAAAALDEFIDDYPDAVNRARSNLAGLADQDYPSADEVRAKFKLSFDFEPIPSSGGFSNLPEALMGKLAAKLEHRQQAMRQSAELAVWEQVRERIERMIGRLADPEAKFKSATVDAVRELVELIPGWNMLGDQRMTEITKDIDRMIAGVSAEKLREDKLVRADVVDQASAVTDKLKSWGL